MIRRAVWINLVLCTVLALRARQATAAEEVCASYTPQSCVFNDKVKLKGAVCRPGPCAFNSQKDLAHCAFTATGRFNYTKPKADGCLDPFMSNYREDPSPCGTRCCRADHSGSFTSGGLIPGNGATKYEFQPTDSSCRYDTITRGQILDFFDSRGVPLLVIGDSMMRQLFLRLVALLRGQPRIVDYHLHMHAQYSVCKEADAFRVAPKSLQTEDEIAAFFSLVAGPGLAASQESLSRCTRPPTNFHYMHAPTWAIQCTALPEYLKALPAGVKPVVLSMVSYWEGSHEVPQNYLDMLEAVAPSTARLYVMSAPTIYVPNKRARPEETYTRQDALRRRNAFMRQWVERQGAPFVFLDFDGLTMAPNRPPRPGPRDKHYSCSIWWNGTRYGNLEPLSEGDRSLAQISSGGGVSFIRAGVDRQCADETQRNLLQVWFNSLLSGSEDRAKTVGSQQLSATLTSWMFKLSPVCLSLASYFFFWRCNFLYCNC